MNCLLLALAVSFLNVFGSSNARDLPFFRSQDGGQVIPKDGHVIPKAGGGSGSTAPSSTAPTNNGNCVCGLRNTAIRIVGGESTTIHEYPWQVALVTSTESPPRPFCGGSIISSQWVLTAAHCVDSSSENSDKVVIGEHNWGTASETPVTQNIVISKVIQHPDYSPSTSDNDVALVKLATPITFPSNNKIAPICLPASSSNLYGNVNAIVTGWGTLSSGGSQPNELNEVTVPTMTNEQCKNTDYFANEITNNMICAGVTGKDSCQGDSGGPLVTKSSSASMEQIGVVSWGYGCAANNYPGVYTRVGNYLSWIQSNISGSTTCPRAP